MSLGESTEEGIFSWITLEFDTNLVSLKPEVLRYEISDKDNLIKLSLSVKQLKSHPYKDYYPLPILTMYLPFQESSLMTNSHNVANLPYQIYAQVSYSH